MKACGDDFSGVPFESTYFEMRCYKKGTLHMHFKDKELWELFNLTGRARQELAPGRCEGTGAGGSHPEQADRPVRPPAFRLTEGPAETRDFFMYFIEKTGFFSLQPKVLWY